MKRMILRERIFGIIVVLLALIVSWFLVISPRISQPGTINAEAAAQNAQAAQYSTKIGQIKAKQADLAKKKAEVNKLNKQFPQSGEPTEITAAVYNAASRAGIPRSKVAITVQKPQPLSAAATTAAPAAGAPADATTGSFVSGVTIVLSNVPVSQVGTFTQTLKNGSRSILTSEVSTANTLATTGVKAASTTTVTAASVLLPPMSS